MGLTIPEVEMSLCKQLAHPAWAALVLTNDLYSWEKERDAAKEANTPHVINAIYVLMGEHSLSETEAQDRCRQKIKEYVAEALRVVEKTKADVDLSLDLRKYIGAILYSVSGNLVWSIYCPRYHPENSYDDVVQSMMAEVPQGPMGIAGVAQ
jgi:fusicocca-2,10(14)-diene synthase